MNQQQSCSGALLPLLPSLQRSTMPRFAITLTLAMALLLPDVSARMRREDPPIHEPATKSCEEMCKVDSGMDADARDCLTECATHTDLMTHNLDRGLGTFVNDESHNEKAPEEVPACTPTVDLDHIPQFSDLDANGDGVIDFEESEKWGEAACVPDEMSEQVFSEADLNQDKVIDESEFKEAGEDTKSEEAMDEALEKVSEGDDEYNSVQNPPLEEFDENKDGALDESEAKEAFEHEIERRTEHEEVPEETMKDLEPDVQEAIDKVDTDDDGEISGAEYTAKDEGSDMGTELGEAASADEDAKEIDDLPRADGAAPPASLLQRHGNRNSAFLQKRKATRKYARAMHAMQQQAKLLADAQRWQRKAQVLRKHAAMLRRNARSNRRFKPVKSMDLR